MLLPIRAAACALAGALLASHAWAAPPATRPDPAARLDAYVQHAGALGFSGELLVAQRGTILLQRGFGFADRAAHRRIDRSTVFYLASLSKQYTAAAILALAAHDQIELSDPIGRFLPRVPADKAGITIRQLLTHTSGLDSFGWDDLAGDWKPMDKSAAVDGILQQPLRHPPDSTFSYTNSGYVLLAAIVERVSGKSFQAFVQDRLLRPAGLANTRFGWNTSGHVRTAKGYSGEIERGSYLDRPHSWLRVGPADAMATVDDLYQWVRALQTHRVLPATMVSEMFSIQRQIEPGYGYGYGWWVRADRDRKPTVIFHAGDFPGFHSEVRWYPADDITVIAATNQEFRGASITEPLLNGIVDVLRGRPSPLPEVAVRTTASGQVSGSWVTPDGSGVIITTTDTGLRVEPIGQTIVDLLSGADPSGTETRRADGARTVDLVLELKHDGAGAYAKALADDVKADLAAFEAEWRQLTDAYGVLLSVQLLGTIPGETALQSRSLVRLKFERATMLMSYAWKDGRLLSTQPRARPEIEPLAFGLEQNGSYAAFDWISGATIHLHPDSGKLTLIASPSRSVTLVRHNP